ncbi:glycosyltransferase family 2 protein [Dermatophilaceae bacterium Soc4.6]
MNPELSVVIPMYNEEDVLPLLVDRLRPTLEATGATYEVIAVDDGSTDLTAALLQRLHREWDAVRVVRLRANAGHQAAISAGLVSARGDYVVTIDADLQDPPEVIGEMLDKARDEGLDVVYGVRGDRSTDTFFKRVTARAFYRTIQRLSATSAQSDAGDFRLMSRATVDAITVLPEHNRVLRFIVPALGFPSGTVEYRREERAAGVSKYPFLKMVKLSVDSVTGFSMAPLRLATLLGIGGGVLAVLLGLFAIIENAAGKAVAGWTSTVVIVAAVGAAQLLCLGLLGEYIGRMYTQMQGRPTYFIAYDSLRAADARRGPTDTPLPPVRRAAGAPLVARTPDPRAVPVTDPTGPGGSSAPGAGGDEQAHTGQLLDR